MRSQVEESRAPWWAASVNLALVVALGTVAVVAHADASLLAGVAVMVRAVVRR